MPDDGFVAAHRVEQDILAAALPGLRAARKTLPPKLFYDAEGCRLFQRITELAEYYPTRTEFKLLDSVAPAVAGLVEPGGALIEYGASDEAKAMSLLRQNIPGGGPVFSTYVPIDVAETALRQVYARLARSVPDLAVYPVVADFLQPFALPALDGLSRLGFFPGSTIGNLEPAEAQHFLAGVRHSLGAAAHLLIGVDLRKDPAILIPAYDDAEGVTAAFNLNLLARLNREADADFDLDGFRHRAEWNDNDSRIEMHLYSLRDQIVHVGGCRIAFRAGESIHTENSYKWTLAGFTRLARAAGWSRRLMWTDPAGMYSMHLLESA